MDFFFKTLYALFLSDAEELLVKTRMAAKEAEMAQKIVEDSGENRSSYTVFPTLPSCNM